MNHIISYYESCVTKFFSKFPKSGKRNSSSFLVAKNFLGPNKHISKLNILHAKLKSFVFNVELLDNFLDVKKLVSQE